MLIQRSEGLRSQGSTSPVKSGWEKVVLMPLEMVGGGVLLPKPFNSVLYGMEFEIAESRGGVGVLPPSSLFRMYAPQGRCIIFLLCRTIC